MEYHPVEYERPTYFQLSVAYADVNYCFANFKYVKGLLMHMLTCYIHRGLP